MLFALSYDYVGDLSETVALMWPTRIVRLPSPPAQRRGGVGRVGGRCGRQCRIQSSEPLTPPTPDPSPPPRARGGRGAHATPGHNNPPPPTLTEVVTTLRTLGKTELPKQLARWLDELDETGRWALLKLVTGAMRIGISARLAKTAAAALGDKDPHDIELMWPGLTPPYLDLFAWLEGRARKAGQSRSRAVPAGDAGACDRG